MSARSVLITGVSRDLGGMLARLLSADPSVMQIVGVDTVPPPGDIGRTKFVRADIRHPLVAKVVAAEAVDTVVHLGVMPAAAAGERVATKEMNVIGTMQLLAACQKSPAVRTVVVRSSTDVYGSSPRDPAVYAEDTPVHASPPTGYAQDVTEVEGYVRGFRRRRADVAVSVLRFAEVIGPGMESALAQYLTLPVTPTVLGHDPRLQVLHRDDALAILRLAVSGGRPGVFNAAGDGVVLVSQVLRRLGRPVAPMPAAVARLAGSALRRVGGPDISPAHLRFLRHGRVVDTTRLHTQFGYAPAYSTADAFEELARERPGILRSSQLAVAAEQVINGALRRSPAHG